MKNEEFKPIMRPRYLPGSVAKRTVENDLALYNRHRFNVFYAQPCVDTTPPKMNPFHYVRMRKLVDEVQRLNDIDRDNKILVTKINVINRTKGVIDSYNRSAYDTASRWSGHETQMLKIQAKNKKIYEELMKVKPTIINSELKRDWQRNLQKMQHMSKFTLQIFLKKSQDELLKEEPSLSDGLLKLCSRPHCFLDFRIKNGARLGRVVVELYVDCVPLTCRNFMALCTGENNRGYKGCLVHKIVKGRYCEMGDVTKFNGKGGSSIYGSNFPEENYKLKHSRPGVLSMIRVGKKRNNSQFCITFSEQKDLDCKRVVFGKVIKGIDTVSYIEDMARRSVGPPTECIVIENCGELRRRKIGAI